MFIWIRRLFRKSGQRFVCGEIVNHIALGFPVKIIGVDQISASQWEYKVMWKGRPGSFVRSVVDVWKDSEIE